MDGEHPIKQVKIIQFVDKILAEALNACNDAAENEDFDSFMAHAGRVRKLVEEGGRLHSRTSITNKMMELCCSVYVQGLPKWTRRMIVRTTSLLF